MKEEFPDKRYWELAEKWMKGTITPEEEQEYAQWYNSLHPEDAVTIPSERAKDQEEYRKKILRQIRKKRTPVVRMAARVYKWTAAAALLLGITVTYIYLSRNKQHDNTAPLVQNAVNDIPAGTDGAILKLSNGQTIVLDTATNGNLLNSTGADITKYNGSIRFSSEQKNNETAYNTLITPRGRQQQLLLSDGTKVWLNAQSSIEFPTAFNKSQREVIVTGEAYFEVAKDVHRPFVVKVAEATIEVLGTHFNVMAYANEDALRTTLLEGSVRFRKHGKNIILKPGQQSELLADNEIKLIKEADVEAAIAWKNGIQVFTSADLKTIMRQIERWYDVDVAFSGGIPERTFSGEIPRNANLSEVLQLFQAAKIRFSIDAQKKKLTVMP